jgi:TolB-like protein
MAAKPVPRERLTELLWGSHFEEQARQNFRQALARLRKAIGSETLVSDDSIVQLAPGVVECDARRFEGLVRGGSAEDVRQAVDLLDGDLLAGVDVKEATWDDWLSEERRRVGNLACEALAKLGRIELDRGRAAEALAHAEACIRRDFFREDAHRLAIEAFAALGRRAEALKHFQTFAERLKQELGTVPEAKTAKACERARSDAGNAAGEPGPFTIRNPSIAVMPFANMSNDPEQDYFADGMVDEIITALSRFHWLFVIARNSTFAYKGRSVDAKSVGRELGVRYVLEGSVRRAGGRIRITGQLIDAEMGTSLWADRFEGGLEDIFELQDQVTAKAVTAIAPKLEQAEIDRATRKPTQRLDVYDHYLQGLAEMYRWTQASNNEALKHFYRAIELDRRFAPAYGMAARLFSQRKVSGWMVDEDKEAAEAEGLARVAIDFGRDDPVALATAGMTLAFVNCKLSEGEDLIERALALNPNFAWGWVFSGWIKNWMGESEAAIARVNRAIAFSPNDPYLYGMRRAIAFAHFVAGRYEQAIAEADADSPSPQALVMILGAVAAGSALLGRTDQAKGFMGKLLAVEPRVTAANLRWWFPLLREEDFARLADGLRLAGLPK